MGKVEFSESFDFLRFFRGEATPEESEKLLKWLEADRRNRLRYFKIKRLWLESLGEKEGEKFAEQSWERIKYRLFNRAEAKKVPRFAGRRTDWKIYAIAASFGLMLIMGTYFLFKIDDLEMFSQQLNHIEVPYGSRSNIILPDGSEVWLNSGSKITYSSGFGKGQRDLTLTGEAFFDVKIRRGTPFVVKTNDLEISVLGTQFNVKSYPDEDVVETLLISGKVVIEDRNKEKEFAKVTLLPSQKMTYVKSKEINAQEKGKPIENKTSAKPIVAKVTTPKSLQVQVSAVRHVETDISWKDEKLVIRSESLGSMARKLERYYNVKIIFLDDRIKEYKFSGTLDEVTIDEVMRAISSTAPIRFQIEKNKVSLNSAR